MPDLDEERKSANSSRQWMIHVHSYGTGTDPARGHQHHIAGVSCPAKISRRSHVHSLPGRTTFSGTDSVELHWHSYDIITDLAVELSDGSHVHYYSGVTSTNAGHNHTFSGSTNLSPDTYLENANNSACKKYKRPEEDDE